MKKKKEFNISQQGHCAIEFVCLVALVVVLLTFCKTQVFISFQSATFHISVYKHITRKDLLVS